MAGNPNASPNPGRNLKLITASASTLDPIPRSLYIAASGTMSITNADGSSEATVPVFQGTVMPIQPNKITAVSSAVVYGIYGE